MVVVEGKFIKESIVVNFDFFNDYFDMEVAVEKIIRNKEGSVGNFME